MSSAVRPNPLGPRVARGLVGAVVGGVAAGLGWYLLIHELALHGWLLGGALGGAAAAVAGCPVGYFAADRGRWRGVPAAIVAAVVVAAVVGYASSRAIDGLGFASNDTSGVIALDTALAAMGAAATAIKKRHVSIGSPGMGALIGLVVLAGGLGTAVWWRSGDKPVVTQPPGRNPSQTPAPLSPQQIIEQCTALKQRATAAIAQANAVTVAGHSETPTYVDDVFDIKNPYYTYFDNGSGHVVRFVLVAKGTPPC